MFQNRALRAKLTFRKGVIGEAWDDQASQAKIAYEVCYGYKRHTTEQFRLAIVAADAILADIDAFLR